MKKYEKYVLQFHSFRSRFTKSWYGVLESNFSLVQHKDRPQVGQVTNILWSAPSFLQKLHRMRISLNSGICWYFLLQWWQQCFSLACSAKRKTLLPIAIPSNQRFCNNNFEIKQWNWITKLRIHNVTIRNGNVDEIEKHPQIKSEFAFTI